MQEPGLKPENIELKRFLVFEDTAPQAARMKVEAGTAAVFQRVDAGRLAAFGFLPYAGYGNLQYNPNFVQIMLRLVAELRGVESLYQLSGRVESWREPHLDRDAAYVLEHEKGQRWTLSVEGVADKTQLLLPPDIGRGFFTVRRNGKEWLRFARGIAPGDAALDGVPAGDLEKLKPLGLTMTEGAVSAGSLARVDLFAWALGFLLAAIAFEAYTHFFRET
jgi:hypothetical protein